MIDKRLQRLWLLQDRVSALHSLLYHTRCGMPELLGEERTEKECEHLIALAEYLAEKVAAMEGGRE